MVVLRGHENAVWCGAGLARGWAGESAAFSPEGTKIVTTSVDTTARVWSVGWKGLVGILRESTTACLTVDQRTRYLGEDVEEAKAEWEGCERGYGRMP